MSAIDQRAATLRAAWRNAQDLSPVAWEAADQREQSIWLRVAAADMPDPASVAPATGAEPVDTARTTARRKP